MKTASPDAQVPVRPYVLLDRDGTVIEDKEYLCDPAQVVLLPGAAEGLKRLAEAGFGLVLVTNQSGIGRGKYDEAAMHRVNARLEAILAGHGVRLDGIYFCPHAPDQPCTCRKPLPGLFEQARAALGVDPSTAFVVGDKDCDVDLGLTVGARSVLVLTGYGQQHAATAGTRAHAVTADLLAAAQWIVQTTHHAMP